MILHVCIKIVTIIIVPSCNLWSIHHRFMLNSPNYTKVLVSDFLWKNSCKLVSDANMSKMSWSGIHCYSHFSNTATHSHIQDSKSGERQPYRSREPYILPFFQKEKTTHKIPRSVTATSNYKSYWTLHITCFCLFLVLLCCRRPRDGHGARGGTPQGEWHAVRDFLWHRDWHPNVRWTQPQWHGNLQCKTFQYNRVYYVMHKVGNIGIKGFPKENFQQQSVSSCRIRSRNLWFC